MPADSARSTASRATWSWSTSRDSSSCRRISRASGTVTVRRLVRLPKRPGSMSRIATSISSAPWPPRIWKVGTVRSGTSTSTVRRSSCPARELRAQLLPRGEERLARRGVGLRRLARQTDARGGSSRSRSRSSTRAAAFSPHLRLLLPADHVDGRRHEVAHDRVHVAAHVAHLGELAGLDLDERAAGELGETTGDLGLAHPGRSDHQDVLRGDVGGDRRGEPAAADPAAERDRHRALGRRLAHHPAVELGHDLARREGVEALALLAPGGGGGRHPSRVSTSMASFV